LLDHYRTLAAPSEFRQKIDRSEFLGIAFSVESEDAFFAELAALTKRHYDATHLCWAFRLFADATFARAAPTPANRRALPENRSSARSKGRTCTTPRSSSSAGTEA
jgi:hypothetical protein